MFEKLHDQRKIQLVFGLLIGIGFGFCLQKGGMTSYNVIIGQLLLTDFTVIKVMLSAVIVGMAGLHIMKHKGWIEFHTFRGSLGSTVVGGCIFGLGFALLGLCPGTVAGAVGTGQMDALFGGVVGMLIGTGLFVHFFPVINRKFMDKGVFPADSVPEYIGKPEWMVVVLMLIIMTAFLCFLEYMGL